MRGAEVEEFKLLLDSPGGIRSSHLGPGAWSGADKRMAGWEVHGHPRRRGPGWSTSFLSQGRLLDPPCLF